MAKKHASDLETNSSLPSKQAIAPVVIKLLDEMRDQLNGRFNQQLKLGAKIDGPSWLRHVQEFIVPIVESVCRYASERGKVTLLDLYDISLELVSAGHFGEEGSSNCLSQLWREVLPKLPTLVSRDPRRIVGSLSNGVLFLKQRSEKQALQWLRLLEIGGILCDDSGTFLKYGKVAAWAVGVSEFRGEAISLAESLPADATKAALSLPQDLTSEQVAGVLRELIWNPWARISGSETGSSPTIQQVTLQEVALQEVAQCGNFRGLGGDFISPPRVFLHDGELCATDDVGVWRVIADRFGSSLVRLNIQPQSKSKSLAKVQVDSSGMILWGNERLLREDLAGSNSSVCNGQTFAITIPTSYRVYLFAKSN